MSLSKETSRTSSTTDVVPGAEGRRQEPNWRGNLLVVATLIATLSFQVGTNVLGGYWQDDEILHKKGDPVPDMPSMFWASTVYGHRAGDAVFSDKYSARYLFFKVTSLVGFISAVLTTLSLMSSVNTSRDHQEPGEGEGQVWELKDQSQEEERRRGHKRDRLRRVKWGMYASYACALLCFIISEPKIPTPMAIGIFAAVVGLSYMVYRIFKRL